jgi:YidC/Oxa1 family membrane protein insertase
MIQYLLKRLNRPFGPSRIFFMASEQKRLFLALSLSAMVLFGWQAFFAPKSNFKPSDSKATSVKTDIDKPIQTVANNSGSVASDSAPTTAPIGAKKPTSLKPVTVVNGENSITIGSNLVFSSIESSLATDSLEAVVGNEAPFRIFLVKEGKRFSPEFALSSNGNSVEGIDSTSGITFKGNLGEDGIFSWGLTSETSHQYYLEMSSSKKEGEGRQIRQFLTLLKDVKRDNVDEEETYEGTLQWIGVDFHYHLLATILDKKAVSSVSIKNSTLGARIIESTKELSGRTVLSLKQFENLEAMGNNLQLSVDFGVFGVIAIPILNGLRFIYKYVPNYGLAIILITLFIRTLLFPLQFKSFKSMKKMQKLQPQLAKVKEKYGDDPQRMQKETMELFKRNGANPMGGCLPLVMQMPVFFAFYQVLFNSVELLNAPFFFWITDLSAKDPYYVLPVLMGIAMFGQTKLNPSTTADPTQQKMMMFMPLIFTFFMKDLPAGLNLYIFVSTLYGIVQQLIVYKTVD